VVNPHHTQIEGLATVKSMEAIAEAPDLVIIAVPPAAVPEAVAQAGRQGVGAAVIITAGLGHGSGSVADATEAAARTTGLRLVGPNCLGVLVPSAHLNASFAIRMPQAGDLAVISQSGAIVAGMIEWAAQRAIGFSALVSVGDQIDVDFGDLLDQFAMDRASRAIVLYIESIKNARKFMSAGPRRGARQAGCCDQGWPAHPRREGGRDAHRRPRWFRRSLRRSLSPRRPSSCVRS